MQTLQIYLFIDCWISRPLFARPQFLNRALFVIVILCVCDGCVDVSDLFSLLAPFNVYLTNAMEVLFRRLCVSIYSVLMPHWSVIAEHLKYDRIRFNMPLCTRGKEASIKPHKPQKKKSERKKQRWKENEIEIACTCFVDCRVRNRSDNCGNQEQKKEKQNKPKLRRKKERAYTSKSSCLEFHWTK